MRYLDMHCDTVTHLLREEDEGRPSELRENNAHIDLLRMKKAGYLLQNFAVFTPLGYVDNPMAFALRAIDKYYEEMEKNNMRCCIMNYRAFMNQSKNDESFTNTVKGNNCLIIDDIEEVLKGDDE